MLKFSQHMKFAVILVISVFVTGCYTQIKTTSYRRYPYREIVQYDENAPVSEEEQEETEEYDNVLGLRDPNVRDSLFFKAARLVVISNQGSVSLLQRRLKIGYARAARLIDQLELAGIVSPYDGSKAREVLADDLYIDDLEAGEI